jgi:hypothetical protein
MRIVCAFFLAITLIGCNETHIESNSENVTIIDENSKELLKQSRVLYFRNNSHINQWNYDSVSYVKSSLDSIRLLYGLAFSELFMASQKMDSKFPFKNLKNFEIDYRVRKMLQNEKSKSVPALIATSIKHSNSIIDLTEQTLRLYSNYKYINHDFTIGFIDSLDLKMISSELEEFSENDDQTQGSFILSKLRNQLLLSEVRFFDYLRSHLYLGCFTSDLYIDFTPYQPIIYLGDSLSVKSFLAAKIASEKQEVFIDGVKISEGYTEGNFKVKATEIGKHQKDVVIKVKNPKTGETTEYNTTFEYLVVEK